MLFHDRSGVKTRSLTRQTVTIVLLAQGLCALLLCGAALLHERQTRLRALDTRLQGRSDSLLGAIQDAEDPQDNVKIDPAELKIPRDDVYAVYNQGGALLGMSENAPPALILRDKDEFRDVTSGGTSYRVLQREAMRIIDRDESGGVGLRRPVTIVYASPEGNIWHEVLRAARFYLGAILLATASSVLVVVLLLRKALRPLSDLATAASRLSAPALQFEAPLSALAMLELRPLAQVLADTVSRLRESFAQQHRFVGDAAHELKTAIAVVRSSVQLLMLKQRTLDEYSVGLERTLQDTQRVEGLVTQMLQLARLEESAVHHMPALDLSQVVSIVAAKLQPVAEMRGLQIKVHAPTEALVRIAPDSAEILVSNLLLNALQHSRTASPVSLSVEHTMTAAVRLEVLDHGEGIGADALPHIFERFYREDRSRSRDTGGSGLGLSICKSIVDAAGGQITIDSVRDAGTRVQIIFSPA